MSKQSPNGWKNFSGVGFDRKGVVRRLKKAEMASTRHAKKFLVSRLNNAKLVRKEVTVWALLVGLMIAGMGVQFGLSQRGYMQVAPQAGGTYAEGALGPISSLNPLYAASSAEASFSRLVFSSLYNYDSAGQLSQDLATSMKVEENGLVYTLDIRKDVLWHDGTKLTAKDIVFTINLIKNPATRSPLRINWVDVNVRAIGQSTVEFRLPAAYAAFPHALVFPILPVHILANVNAGAIRESPFSRSPVGSGPFVFKLLQRADAIMNHEVVHLAANPDYYGGRIKLDQFEIYAFQAEEDIKKAIKGNEVNGAVDVQGLTAEDLGSQYAVTPAPLASGVYALLNNLNPVLSDVKVRKALQIGTDTSKVRKVIDRQSAKLELPFIDGQLSGADVPAVPALNTAGAAMMLDEAGWKLNGQTRTKDGSPPLQITITTTRARQYRLAAQELARQWEGLGIVVKINTVDTTNVSASFIQNVLQQRNFDVLLYELSIGADPDVYAYWHSSQGGGNISGYNFTNYSNKNADATLASARSRPEPELRNAKYVAFAKQWLQDAPAIALYQPVVEYVSHKSDNAVVKGAKLTVQADRFYNVKHWSVQDNAVYKTP